MAAVLHRTLTHFTHLLIAKLHMYNIRENRVLNYKRYNNVELQEVQECLLSFEQARSPHFQSPARQTLQ